ncbi:SDR family oxidoreductase [Streptomyces sp. NPDC002521]
MAGLRLAATDSPAYDSSKAGLSRLTRHAAKEGEPRGIRADLVVPGPIDTPMSREASRRRTSRSASFTRIPLGRQGTAWEVAEVVAFLPSEPTLCSCSPGFTSVRFVHRFPQPFPGRALHRVHGLVRAGGYGPDEATLFSVGDLGATHSRP